MDIEDKYYVLSKDKTIFPHNYTFMSNKVIHKYMFKKRSPYMFFSQIKLFENAKITKIDDGVFTTNDLEIQEIKHIKDFELWENENFCEYMIKTYKCSIVYVKCHTQKIHLLAVSVCGLNLKYIDDQDDELCLRAVTKNGMALQHVKNKTDKIKIAAITNNSYAIQFIDNPTREMCIIAVKKCGYVLKFIKNQNQTEEICICAIENHSMAFDSVVNKTVSIIETTIKKFGGYINIAEVITIDLIISAVKTAPWIIQYKRVIPLITDELLSQLIDINYKCFNHMDEKSQTIEMCEKMMHINPLTYAHIKSTIIKKQLQDLFIQIMSEKYKLYYNFAKIYVEYLDSKLKLINRETMTFLFTTFSISDLKIIIKQRNKIYDLFVDFITFDVITKYGIKYESENSYNMSLSYNELRHEHYTLLNSLVFVPPSSLVELLNGNIVDVNIHKKNVFDHVEVNNFVDFHNYKDDIEHDEYILETHIIDGMEQKIKRKVYSISYEEMDSWSTFLENEKSV